MKRLLAAIDTSARATAVLRAALEFAAPLGATVHVFRAVYLPPELPPAAATAPDVIAKLLAEQATADLVNLTNGTPAVIEPPTAGARAVWREVLEAARRVDADLIVIGSHGHSGWDTVLGTNAARIVDHADRSVLVVHERQAGNAT